MIIVVCCLSCGKVLADKWEYYEREIAKIDAAKETEKRDKEGKPELKNMDPKTVGKVLDDLGLTRLCCRRHMIANKDLMDLI